MKIYFTYKGKGIEKTDLSKAYCDSLQFETTEGLEFIFDLRGEVDVSSLTDTIIGRFKGEAVSICGSKSDTLKLTENEIATVLSQADKDTIVFGLFDEGNEPEWESLELDIMIADRTFTFNLEG